MHHNGALAPQQSQQKMIIIVIHRFALREEYRSQNQKTTHPSHSFTNLECLRLTLQSFLFANGVVAATTAEHNFCIAFREHTACCTFMIVTYLPSYFSYSRFIIIGNHFIPRRVNTIYLCFQMHCALGLICGLL